MSEGSAIVTSVHPGEPDTSGMLLGNSFKAGANIIPEPNINKQKRFE